MTKKKTSGLEGVPRFLEKPVWKDPILWIGLATAAAWCLVLWWLFA